MIGVRTFYLLSEDVLYLMMELPVLKGGCSIIKIGRPV
jgi:hypothetical protein